MNATATSTKSKVRGLGAKDLVEGKNTLPIRVIAEDGSEKIYNVNVTRKAGATSLKNEIMKNKIITAEPTLTTSSNNTSDASGLYKSTATNTGEPTYYFRGNVENNYVSFASFTWRIVRVNEDGTIRIVMQDGINNNTKYAFNSIKDNSMNMYYTNSEVKPILENWYQTNIGSKAYLAKNVVSGNYYCEQAKVKKVEGWSSESTIMTTYTSYTPNFKCESDGNGYGIVNSNVGLLTYDEVVYAGGYVSLAGEINNTSYYLLKNYLSFTMSPGGIVNSIYPMIWSYNNIIGSGNFVSSPELLVPVLNLTANTQISDGDGTKDNPFVVE